MNVSVCLRTLTLVLKNDERWMNVLHSTGASALAFWAHSTSPWGAYRTFLLCFRKIWVLNSLMKRKDNFLMFLCALVKPRTVIRAQLSAGAEPVLTWDVTALPECFPSSQLIFGCGKSCQMVWPEAEWSSSLLGQFYQFILCTGELKSRYSGKLRYWLEMSRMKLNHTPFASFQNVCLWFS